MQLVAFLAYLEQSQRSVSIDLSEDGSTGGGEDVATDGEPSVGEEMREAADAIAEMGSNQATDGDNDEVDDDDRDFWFGDDEGIHVYGMDDPSGGQVRHFINLTDFADR